MRKLMLSVLVVASLGAGAAFADAESQAGSAWRSNPDYGPIPGTPEYYGNSGWPPPQEPQPYIYGNPGFVPYGYPNAEPVYPSERRRRADRDRDGDGVPNRRDRRPDDPYRY